MEKLVRIRRIKHGILVESIDERKNRKRPRGLKINRDISSERGRKGDTRKRFIWWGDLGRTHGRKNNGMGKMGRERQRQRTGMQSEIENG